MLPATGRACGWYQRPAPVRCVGPALAQAHRGWHPPDKASTVGWQRYLMGEDQLRYPGPITAEQRPLNQIGIGHQGKAGQAIQPAGHALPMPLRNLVVLIVIRIPGLPSLRGGEVPALSSCLGEQ